MTGALVILGALVVIGALLYITDVKYFRHHHHDSASRQDENSTSGNSYGNASTKAEAAKAFQNGNPTDEDICCGQHLVCEKTSLAVVSDEIIYYDDEELDRFKGRNPEEYSSDEIEEFRDVLLTLMPEDVAGWARSISLRNIPLPPMVKDELLLFITELRKE